MRTMIVPGLHARHDDAEELIASESPDRVVFLGDYFDEWDLAADDARATAAWLVRSMRDEKRTHLLGNHELSYMDSRHRSPGFTEANLSAINESGVDLESLPLYAWVDGWLCTHAGLSKSFLRQHSKRDPGEFLKNWSEIRDSRLYQASWIFAGKLQHAGIIRCDYADFVPVPGLKQVFGHTKSDSVHVRDDCICLDTELRNYAVCEDGRMRVSKCVKCSA